MVFEHVSSSWGKFLLQRKLCSLESRKREVVSVAEFYMHGTEAQRLCPALFSSFCQMEWTQCPWGDGENLWWIKGASLHFSGLIVVLAPSLFIAGPHKVFINTKSVADVNNFTVNLRTLSIFFLKVQLLEPHLYDNLTCTGEKKNGF